MTTKAKPKRPAKTTASKPAAKKTAKTATSAKKASTRTRKPAAAKPRADKKTAAPRKSAATATTARKAIPKPPLSVVIVTRDSTASLRECLNSLANDGYSEILSSKGGEREIVVIDAGSGEYTPTVVAREFPEVTLVTRRDSMGSARSTNLAINATTGSYVLVLEPGVRVAEGTVARMVEYMENHLHVGAMAPTVLDGQGSAVAGPRSFPSLRGEFAQEWQGLAEAVGLAADAAPAMSKPGPVEWVPRTCMLLRRNALKQVGNLDEGYSMHYAEADWCRRARRSGWAVHFHPGIEVVHENHRELGEQDLKGWSKHQFKTSRRYYFTKHHGAPAAALVEVLHGLRNAAEATKRLLGGARPVAAPSRRPSEHRGESGRAV